MMRKSVKSVQNLLNETMSWLDEPLVTASAYSQARYQLKHTAFIELNQKAIVNTLYSDEDYKKFWGFRILAIDGSKRVLPNTADVCAEFGTIAWSQGKKADALQGEKPYAVASVLYDVLNRVAIDARLGGAKAYEVDLAVQHLPHTCHGDLLIMDRNYPSYRMLAELSKAGRDFVIRCSASFAVAQQMLKGGGKGSRLVTLTPSTQQLAAIQQLGLPTSLTVRFVRVVLPTGELEVLVSSLHDEFLYPTNDFLTLYYLRWGIETFYGLLKTRVNLENFTGTGAEAVRQDFHASIYLTGLETLLCADAQQQLDAKTTQHAQVVNRAVSFNAIKNHALALLFSDKPSDEVLEKLTELFLTNPCLQRPDRNPPRTSSSSRLLLHFAKRQKKHCF